VTNVPHLLLQAVTEAFWTNANELASDHERPGDLNQSLMELGATICTPKTPKCEQCPVSDFCLAAADEAKRANGENKPKATCTPDIEGRRAGMPARRTKTNFRQLTF
jgi:adenine-specific DNA glycosylase